MRVGVAGRTAVALACVALMAGLATAPVATAADPIPRSGIWQEMREGRGYVVLLRHAIAPGSGDPAGFRLGDCSTQRNLSAEGRRQAVAIGALWRSQRMPVDRVLTSRWCRARDTARLLAVGRVAAYPSLDSSFTVSGDVARQRAAKVRQLIVRHRGKPGVLVLVGHQVNITAVTGIAPASGGAVVVKARADGSLRIVGTLSAP